MLWLTHNINNKKRTCCTSFLPFQKRCSLNFLNKKVIIDSSLHKSFIYSWLCSTLEVSEYIFSWCFWSKRSEHPIHLHKTQWGDWFDHETRQQGPQPLDTRYLSVRSLPSSFKPCQGQKSGYIENDCPIPSQWSFPISAPITKSKSVSRQNNVSLTSSGPGGTWY